MMNSGEPITLKCIPVTQPIGTFYISAMDAKDLIAISWVDVQRIEQREVEEFLGIQRPLSPARVDEIAKYVNTVDATFPSSILIAVSSSDVTYDESADVMTISRNEGVAKIIDGQHRIAGLEQFSDGTFQVNVTIFVDMDIEDQAMVFSTINLKQTTVSKSLSYNLYEYTKSRSPQKTCHNIAKLLNGREGSPFEHRIKILGFATPGRSDETITQGAFVEQLINLISRDPISDRDILKRNKTPKKADINELKRRIFRNMFLDQRDAEIARALWNYFSAVQDRWPRAWGEVDTGLVLNQTVGFYALMRLLRYIYVAVDKLDLVITQREFKEIFDRATMTDDDFNRDNYSPSGGGVGRLFNDLLEQTGASEALVLAGE